MSLSSTYRFCPQCTRPLTVMPVGGRDRLCCDDARCGFVLWDNPVPVVAAVVEHEGKIILARNVAWPRHFYALITGFLEAGESPEIGVQREVEEELGLEPLGANFIGLYDFFRKNQLLIAYHVPARGTVKLNEELDDWKHVAFDDVVYWPAGTGYALRDWLQRQGYSPREGESPNIRS